MAGGFIADFDLFMGKCASCSCLNVLRFSSWVTSFFSFLFLKNNVSYLDFVVEGHL